MKFTINPCVSIVGKIIVPGDKSISHRAIMLGALAEGVTTVTGFLRGEDCLATMRVFQQMGVVIDDDGEQLRIHGVGLHGLRAPSMALDVGNAGTCIRLLSGVMVGQTFASELIGDESIMKRPMMRVAKPLRQMGADIQVEEAGTPPIRIKPVKHLQGINYDSPIASAQVKSCVLLAGLYAEGETSVTEPGISRDHTERMLESFGYILVEQANRVSLQGGGQLTATDIHVPGDISSAAFFLVAASIAKDGNVLIKNVGINPTRDGVITILNLMGADITLENKRHVGAEPVADIRVRSAKLKGINIPEHLVPLAIDEFPALFIAAACAEGETILTGAKELRVKESDRIQAMADGLQTLCIVAEPREDGIRIVGGQMQGGEIESHGDHRIAMAFAIASVAAQDQIIINDVANVSTSFPNFVELGNSLGFDVTS